MVQGFMQGWIFPAETIIWGKYCSDKEKTLLSGLTMSFMYGGIILGSYLTPLIIMSVDWIFFFNLIGITSVVWSIGWGVFSTDMAISQRAALESLDSDFQPPRRRKLSVIPVIKSHQFWITSAGQVMMSALVILLTSSIPKFLYQVYGIPKDCYGIYTFLTVKFTVHLYCIVSEGMLLITKERETFQLLLSSVLRHLRHYPRCSMGK